MILLHWRFRAARAKRKNRTKQGQLAYAGVILLALGLYVILTGMAAVLTAAELMQPSDTTISTNSSVSRAEQGALRSESQPVINSMVNGVRRVGAALWHVARQVSVPLVVFLTFLGFLVPLDLKKVVERVAQERHPR